MAKTKFKQLLIVFLLLVTAVCFCACGEVNSRIIVKENGSIEEVVTITYDNEKIKQAGYTSAQILELKEQVKADAETVGKNMNKALNDKVDAKILTTADKETVEILKSYYNGISMFDGSNENVYSVKVVFKNYDVYKFYYNISEDAKTEKKVEEHFFYSKVYWYGGTMYMRHRELYDTLKSLYEEKYSNLINHEENKLTYTYVCDLRREHSNADYIEKGEDGYYHTWVIDKEQATEQTIMFYYNIANSGNWILVCILITVVVTLIMFGSAGIYQLIKKKNRKE